MVRGYRNSIFSFWGTAVPLSRRLPILPQQYHRRILKVQATIPRIEKWDRSKWKGTYREGVCPRREETSRRVRGASVCKLRLWRVDVWHTEGSQARPRRGRKQLGENGGRTSVTSSQKETQPGQEGNDKRLTKEMQTQLASCLHLLGWQPWKDTENKSWQGRRHKRTLVCSWLNANSYSHYENFYGGSSKQNKKLKLVTTMWPHHSFYWVHIWRK